MAHYRYKDVAAKTPEEMDAYRKAYYLSFGDHPIGRIKIQNFYENPMGEIDIFAYDPNTDTESFFDSLPADPPWWTIVDGHVVINDTVTDEINVILAEIIAS